MSGEIEIAGRAVGGGAPCYVIAEIGVNHGGAVDAAEAMILAAAEAGADAGKLQIVDADAAYLPNTPSYAEFKDKGLSDADLTRLMATAARVGLHLFATPGDPVSLERIVRLGMPAVKISSGLMSNTPMLRAAARVGVPLIVSTGMATAAEVEAALGTLDAAGAERVALLHCVSLYPSPPETVNLRAMDALGAFGRPVGYSDHCQGSLACLAAVAAGAALIEKHFSLDPSQPGADHHLSAGPEELAALMRDIRAIEAMRGDGVKAPHPEERAAEKGRHRFLVAARPLARGVRLEETMLAAKRTLPGVGEIPAMEIDAVVGRALARDLALDEPLSQSDLSSAS